MRTYNNYRLLFFQKVKLFKRQGMICKKCGAELYKGVKFCGECGAAVDKVDDDKSASTFQRYGLQNRNKRRIIITVIVIFVFAISGFLIYWNSGNNADEENIQINSETQDNQTFFQNSDENSNIAKNPEALEVTQYGFDYNDGYSACGFIVKNKSNSEIKDVASYKIIAKNKAGEILDTREDALAVSLKQGEKTGRTAFFETQEKPYKIEFEINYNNAIYTDVDIFPVNNIRVYKDDWDEINITGEINNERDKKYEVGYVYAIFRDKKKNIICGKDTILTTINANQKTAFKIETLRSFTYADVEVYSIGYNY